MATVKQALTGNSPITERTPEHAGAGTAKGLPFERYFTDGKMSPFDAVEWEKRTALIGNEKGVTIFRQGRRRSAEGWSQTATNIDHQQNISTASRARESAKARCGN